MINYKNLYAGAMVLNEFKEKLKALCGEYTQKRAEACPENYAGELWDYDNQTIHSIKIQASAEENHITRNELVSENFVCAHSSDTTDFYEKYINGIKIIYSIKKDSISNNEENAT